MQFCGYASPKSLSYLLLRIQKLGGGKLFLGSEVSHLEIEMLEKNPKFFFLQEQSFEVTRDLVCI